MRLTIPVFAAAVCFAMARGGNHNGGVHSQQRLAAVDSNSEDDSSSSDTDMSTMSDVHPSGCLPLAGIVSGGGEGMLDLDAVGLTVAREPFDLALLPIPTVAICSGGLETPVSMRNLLGEHHLLVVGF